MPRVIGELPEELEPEKDDGEVKAMEKIASAISELQAQVRANQEANRDSITLSVKSIEAILNTMMAHIQGYKPQPVTVNIPKKEPVVRVFNIQRDHEGNIAKVTVTEGEAK